METECEKLQDYVKDITDKFLAKSNALHSKYVSKLDGIKDVTAQYFSKYEKHLFNQQYVSRWKM